MTSTAAALHTTPARLRPSGFELLVARVAVGMLRWSRRSTERQEIARARLAVRPVVTRETGAADFSRQTRMMRLG